MAEEQQRWAGDGLDPDDLAIPEVKLIQKTGGDIAKDSGAEPGQFYSELTDETFEEFDFVTASIQKSRTYWGRTEIEDEPPECSSMDMVEGNFGLCADCEFRNDAPWLLKAEERRTKCLINYSITGLNLSNGLPILIRCSGLSSQAAKQLYTQLSLHPMVAGNWFRARSKVTSVKKNTPYGDAYAFRFGALELIPEDKQPAIRQRIIALAGQQVALPEGRTDDVPAGNVENSETIVSPEASGDAEKKPENLKSPIKPAEAVDKVMQEETKTIEEQEASAEQVIKEADESLAKKGKQEEKQHIEPVNMEF